MAFDGGCDCCMPFVKFGIILHYLCRPERDKNDGTENGMTYREGLWPKLRLSHCDKVYVLLIFIKSRTSI